MEKRKVRLKVARLNPLLVLTSDNWEKIKLICKQRGLNAEEDWMVVLNECLVDYFSGRKHRSRKFSEELQLIGLQKSSAHQ